MSFIPYQVDYSVQNAAKTLGFSKKRVTFKFGFADKAAIQAGQMGPQCRGSEHEIIFIWSLASGKRQILCDNKDVHFSATGQNGWTYDKAWQHVFTLRDSRNQSYRVLFLSQPAAKDIPNHHPFDIKIGGLSYFQFNPIYQLGTPQMVVGQAPSSSHHHSGRDSPMSAEERQQLAAAKLASLQDIAAQKERELKKEPPAPAPAPPLDAPLISFDDALPPAPPPAVPTTLQPNSGTLFSASSISLDPMLQDASLEFNRQQPGSFYSSSSNPSPYAASMGSSSGGGYGMPTPNNPYAAAASPAAASTALTPYQPTAAAPPQQPYVDATGRLNMSSSGGLSYSAASQPYANPYDFAAPPPPLPSPSTMSYGSAPSFAQPPKPYGAESYANPYAAPAPAEASPYANPYAAPVAPADASPYANPYAAPAPTDASPYANPYAAPAPTEATSAYANPYAAPPAEASPYTNPYAAPTSPYGAAPPPYAATNPYGTTGPAYGGGYPPATTYPSY